jgi:MFS transporter, DHA1 family, multidrug resistance protein
MRDILRDSALGQTFRLLTRRKRLAYPEEDETFQLPSGNGQVGKGNVSPVTKLSISPSSSFERSNFVKRDEEAVDSLSHEHSLNTRCNQEQRIERTTTCNTGDQTRRMETKPNETKASYMIVDWYCEDDPENPQNWSSGKKAWVAAQITIYTFAVYIGSSLYSPAEVEVVRIFGVSREVSSLGLALYILGYGTGPMLWSPLSEIPGVGRNPVYLITFTLMVILCIPTALVSSYGGFLALRFFLGFFGSPALATGGATMADMYPPNKLPYLCAIWVAGATCGK